jgi:DNA-binding protein Fis
MKICNLCKKELDDTKFGKVSSHKDSKSYRCLNCSKESKRLSRPKEYDIYEEIKSRPSVVLNSLLNEINNIISLYVDEMKTISDITKIYKLKDSGVIRKILVENNIQIRKNKKSEEEKRERKKKYLKKYYNDNKGREVTNVYSSNLKIIEENRDDVIRMYTEEHKTYAEIKRFLNIKDFNSIKIFLRNNNIELINNSRRNDVDENEVIRLYQDENISIKDIANRYSLKSTKVINRILRDNNIKIKNKAFINYKKQEYLKSRWSGADEICKSYFTLLRHGAERRGLEFNIDREYAISILHDQRYKCPISGLELNLPILWKFRNKANASIDRIDSNLGYIEGNIQWVDKFVNNLKLEYSNKELFEIVEMIENKRLQFNQGIGYTIDELPYCVYGVVLYRSNNRDLEFEITMDDLVNQFNKQNGLCALSGQILTIPADNEDFRKFGHNMSLDRIDSSNGYTKQNIQWIDKRINKMKWDLPNNEFISLCSTIYNHMKDSEIL